MILPLPWVDLDRGTEVSHIAQASTANVNTQRYDAPDLISAGGSFYLASNTDAQISYTKVPTRPEILDVSDQALTTDGSRVILLFSDGSLQLLPSGTDANRPLASAPPPQPSWTPSNGDLRRSCDGSLVVNWEGPNVVTVRRTATLRQTTRITTDMPPPDPGGQSGLGQGGITGTFYYFFDSTGRLITVAGTRVQQWDPLTGRQLGHFDAQSLVRPGDSVAGYGPSHVEIDAYPAANQVAVSIEGDPVIHIVNVTTGRTTTTITTNTNDILAVEFDPSGRYYALLRRATVVELWQRDPPRRELGPLRSLHGSPSDTAYQAGFLEGNGRYLIAANDAIRTYQIGQQAPVDSYEFGHPDGTGAQTPYKFVSVSRDGRTVLYFDQNGLGGALVLDPAVWSRELCAIIGDRSFTPDELAGLPALIPTPQVCPSTR